MMLHGLSNASLSCTLRLGASSVTLGLSFLCCEDDRRAWDGGTHCNPSTEEAEVGGFEFKPSLDHLVNSRPVCPTEKDFVYKQKQKRC